jgi:hypothetical protein
MIQAFTRERNNGWTTEPVRDKNFRRLTSPGGAPLLVNNINAIVEFKNIASPESWEIWKLDSAGYRTEQLQWNNDTAVLELPEDAMYIELVKK